MWVQILKYQKHKYGKRIWSSLISLGTRALPYATKAAPALATGALSALGSLGIDKIFGSGLTDGFLIPDSKIQQLIKNKHLLTTKQKQDILNAFQSDSGALYLRPTQKQINGSFLGAVASIGIPLAIEIASKLFGKGLSVSPKASSISSAKRGGKGLTVSPKPGMLMPYLPPPFPVGMGVRKKTLKTKRKPIQRIPLLGTIL